MAVELEIRDGEPWWLSPDIWTVPGSDPEGAPGVPVAGQSCYLWARVTNNGISSVNNAEVRFYWANPATGFDRNSATRVGTANVNLLSGEAADVLCLTPWIPEYVNNGHECVLAEAYHSTLDPLPPTPTFDVPTDRHVAQRNLGVVQAVKGFFAFPLTFHNRLRLATDCRIKIYLGRIEELEPLQQRLELKLPKTKGKLVESALVEQQCPAEEVLQKTRKELPELSIPGKDSRFRTLAGRIEGGAVLVHVAQFRGEQLVGGYSLLVLP